ncbi:rho GTPase-activating protein 17-like isoform X4 [Ylistrum balloti]|uniref:rho GTPase-activating protein 17-like isoform X4 n=1 Tax=Ylistrum balloti TaxID=509963 RepID=UPI002905C5A1|nr:rho GTPase-activating protein 17-like isoform X4 [Ylistrum balloti]
MLKRENLRKNFLRVKQMADQNLGRAEKSEVLSEDLQTIEKRVELVKTVVQITSKKVAGSLQSSAGMDVEKRLRKLPETNLAHSLIENANLLGKDSVMGNMFQMCGECESNLASNALQYEIDVEAKVLGPLQEMFDNDLPGIAKCKKQLSKLTLDMDSARSRWNTAMKSTQVHGTNMASASAKADTIKEEYEDSVTRMGQARDTLATEMYNFISKEAEHSQKLLVLMETQAEYHRKALEIVKKMLPKMKEALECNPHKPVFGTTLDEHLRVTGRDIALPLEACVLTLLETGVEEEGLFRIAGMASRVKKLKKSFDAGVIDMEEYSLDPHSVAGVLKQYLREMAEPLLTYQLYQEFLQAAQMPQDQRLQALWTSIHNLPEHNYNNFRYLIKFLALLASKSDVNKMTASNISIVIGPNLLWSEGDNGPNMLTSGTMSNLVESIISHANWFFPEEVDFGNYALYASSNEGPLEGEHSSDHEGSFSSGNQASSTTGSPRVSLTSPHSPNMNTSTSPSSTTEESNSVGLAAPLAESEQTSPKIQRRATRKPAPPPPPNRPFSVAVTASVTKPVQYQTWPRQGGVVEPENAGGEETSDRIKAPPERPSIPPEKPSHAPHRSSTISHSHSERPSMPPPDRPKIPPPMAPMHQRSASTGSPNSILVTSLGDSTSPQNGQGSLSSSKAAQDLTSIGDHPQISSSHGSGPLLTSQYNQLPQPVDPTPISNRLSCQVTARPVPARPSPPPPLASNEKTEDTKL